MPLSNEALRGIRALLYQAIKLLQSIIETIDKSLGSDKSTQVYEIRHYCVWAFPPNAPGTIGPGIYSGEHPEVYNIIKREAGLEHITGALQLHRYDSVFQAKGRWQLDMPQSVRREGTLPAEPRVFEFYPNTGGPIDHWVA